METPTTGATPPGIGEWRFFEDVFVVKWNPGNVDPRLGGRENENDDVMDYQEKMLWAGVVVVLLLLFLLLLAAGRSVRAGIESPQSN